MIVIALSLVRAHLLADFVLQRRAVVPREPSRCMKAHCERASLRLLAAEACLAAFSSVELFAWAAPRLLVAYVPLHLVCDARELEDARRVYCSGRWQAFVLDQAGHVGIAVVLAWVLAGAPPDPPRSREAMETLVVSLAHGGRDIRLDGVRIWRPQRCRFGSMGTAARG